MCMLCMCSIVMYGCNMCMVILHDIELMPESTLGNVLS